MIIIYNNDGTHNHLVPSFDGSQWSYSKPSVGPTDVGSCEASTGDDFDFGEAPAPSRAPAPAPAPASKAGVELTM